MGLNHMYPYKDSEYPISELIKFAPHEMTGAFLSMRIRMNVKERGMDLKTAVVEAVNRDPKDKTRMYKKNKPPGRPKKASDEPEITFNNLHIKYF